MYFLQNVLIRRKKTENKWIAHPTQDTGKRTKATKIEEKKALKDKHRNLMGIKPVTQEWII